jgi:hypothetical protein
VTDAPDADRVDPSSEADLATDDAELDALLSDAGEPEALTELSDTAKKFLDHPDVDTAS